MAENNEAIETEQAPFFYEWTSLFSSILVVVSIFSLLQNAFAMGLAPSINSLIDSYHDLSRYLVAPALQAIRGVFPGVAIGVSDAAIDVAVVLLVSVTVFIRGLAPVFLEYGARGLAIVVSSLVLGVVQVLEGAFTNWLTASPSAPGVTIESVMISFIVAMPSAVILPAIGEGVRSLVGGGYSEDAPIIFAMARTYVVILVAASAAGFAFLVLNGA